MLPNWASVKGARVNGTATTVSGKEFREGGVKVIRDEGGDDIFVAIWNDKEVTCTNGIKVVLPSRAREYTWLRASRTWSTSFCISVHRFGC